ncbi:efflux transporter periplasmic adaptor subunit, partial [Mangrovicoccus sp. HB182678]|nr:efflux transporter periplasmic adaptor subunit [Mangrovicoccus algicola]
MSKTVIALALCATLAAPAGFADPATTGPGVLVSQAAGGTAGLGGGGAAAGAGA